MISSCHEINIFYLAAVINMIICNYNEHNHNEQNKNKSNKVSLQNTRSFIQLVHFIEHLKSKFVSLKSEEYWIIVALCTESEEVWFQKWCSLL